MDVSSQDLVSVYLDACPPGSAAGRADVVARMQDLGPSVARSGSASLTRAYARTSRLLALAFDDDSLEDEIALPEMLGPISAEGAPGISVVTCAMNRSENLIAAMPSWLRHPEFEEIVVVDWSSDLPVRDALARAGIDDPRIRVVRVEGAPRWVLSHAFNTGFRVARHDTILKLDADVVLSDDILSVHGSPGPDGFFAGNWRIAAEDQAHVNGVFFVPRAALACAGGFNEFITTYGWDDDDLYARLEALGYRRRDIAPSTVHHLPHADDLRTGGGVAPAASARDWLLASPRFQIQRNRRLAELLPRWEPAMEPLPLRVRDRREADLTLAIAGPPASPVPEDIFDRATREMMREMMAWDYGSAARDLPQETFDRLMDLPASRLSADLFANASAGPDGGPAPAVAAGRDRVFIDAQHGLGNRLRAIGSAAALAEATDRELVIVWQPDDHCDCRFSDLFDYDGAVIERSFPDDAGDCDVHNYMAVEGGEKDAPIRETEGRDIYVRSAFVLNSPHSDWTRENRFIQSLAPVDAVRALVESVPNPADVSAHVRMVGGRRYEHLPSERPDHWSAEDHALIDHWRTRSHFSHFMARLDQLIADGQATRVFVAADLPETYDEFRARYGDRIAYLPRKLYDRSAEQLQYALADATLLSRAPRMLGSTWSSFSELALRLAPGKIQQEMSGKDF
jgi:hypothetical protein